MTRDWDSKPPMSWGDVADLLAEAQMTRRILRKLLVPEKEYEQHYVDLEMGVFDCRVDLTDEEIAYCQAMRLIDGEACDG